MCYDGAMTRLRYGTSSWSEKSWVGPFYPPGTQPGDYLAHYAKQFGTVEADNTYYRVPTRAMVRGWLEKTPDDFVLAAKFPRSVVHAGKSEAPDPSRMFDREETVRFLDAMRELGPKCGPLVLQFPYLNQRAFPSLRAFLDRLEPFLASLPDAHRYGVEVRNKTWIVPELLDVLRRHRAALVLVDLAYMPHPAEIAHDLVTTDFAYVRLIGDRKAVEERTKTFDKIVLDHGARLDRWAELLRDLLPRVSETFAYANNHYEGHGPDTIRSLARRLEAPSG